MGNLPKVRCSSKLITLAVSNPLTISLSADGHQSGKISAITRLGWQKTMADESTIMDTVEMWRFGDFKNYTSLQLLAYTLGVPSPKDDIDGSMVSDVYGNDNDIERIVTYCQKDVQTVIQVMMRYAGLPLFDDKNVEIINQKQE